jgi:hypothetical protein
MSDLPYLKGVRTRYFNFLEKELRTGDNLLETSIESISPEEYKKLEHSVNESKLKIDIYIDKLTVQKR